MATGNRTLKLSILADVDDLKKKLGEADKAVEQNSSRIGDFSAKVGKAFLVAGAAAAAYAGKLLYDGVKAAIEDEKANAQLAATLTNVAGATDNTIASVLAYSRATELATGVTEDELRPSLNRLAIATKDANEAMRLQKVALDVAAGSGKSLDAVTTALAKAFEGNKTALGRLGVGLSAAELKTMSFEDITKSLANTFGGQADVAANTFEGRIKRLQLTFEDARDSMAERLLPIVEKFINFVLNTVIPKLREFAQNFDPIKKAIEDNKQSFEEFVRLLQIVVLPIVSKVFTLMIEVGAKAATAIINAFGAIAGAVTPVLNFIIDAINTVIRGINLVKPGADIGGLNRIGSSGSSFDYRAGERGLPSVSTATPQTQPTVINNISVQSIDPEGAARAVQKVLIDSSARSTPTFGGGGFGIVFQ